MTAVASAEAVVADEIQASAVMKDAPAAIISPAAVEADAPLLHFLEVIPHEFARRHLVLAVQDAGGSVLLHSAAADSAVVHNVSLRLGTDLPHRIVDAEALARRIDLAYESALPEQASAAHSEVPTIRYAADAASAAAPDELELALAAAQGDADLLSLDGKGPVVRLVDSVIFDAIARGASDIHVQPLGDGTLIRFRIDGVLLTVRRAPARLAASIVARIKVMARMDVVERRAPQDGRATVWLGRVGGREGRAVDLRISTLPSTFGERVVIRLLDIRSGLQHASVEALTMPEDVRRRFLDRASRSSGIVLVTGPTGSGKTTTLYATLRWIAERSFTGGAAADVNILTIEDPVEYDLSAAAGTVSLPISQTQVDARKGMTFAHGLRHILRQDPDVIMIGEVRDEETARIAIQASLTGHLVFSTLHTNDACGAITRMMDLGIEPYLVSASLSAVLAQRLVRITHAACKGTGCVECLHSGYRGRRGLFELLVIDERLRGLIGKNADADTLRAAAVVGGLRRLEDEGRSMVAAGVTTSAEVERVTKGAE